MLYYPLNPDKSFVKRVIAEEGDTVRIVDGRVYVNDVPMDDRFVAPEFRSHDDFGPDRRARGLLLRDGRSPEQQLRQPPLGLRAEEIHHRQGAAAVVADTDRACVLSAAVNSKCKQIASRYANVYRCLRLCLHFAFCILN